MVAVCGVELYSAQAILCPSDCLLCSDLVFVCDGCSCNVPCVFLLPFYSVAGARRDY